MFNMGTTSLDPGSSLYLSQWGPKTRSEFRGLVRVEITTNAASLVPAGVVPGLKLYAASSSNVKITMPVERV